MFWFWGVQPIGELDRFSENEGEDFLASWVVGGLVWGEERRGGREREGVGIFEFVGIWYCEGIRRGWG